MMSITYWKLAVHQYYAQSFINIVSLDPPLVITGPILEKAEVQRG